MKKINVILILIVTFCAYSCVQKSYDQSVNLILDVSGIKDIQTVGVRGEGKPLDWDKDLPMKEVIKDSLYAVTVTGKTGYLFTELKFTINGEFELKDKSNRKVVFDASRNTIYKAKFNQP